MQWRSHRRIQKKTSPHFWHAEGNRQIRNVPALPRADLEAEAAVRPVA